MALKENLKWEYLCNCKDKIRESIEVKLNKFRVFQTIFIRIIITVNEKLQMIEKISNRIWANDKEELKQIYSGTVCDSTVVLNY